MSERNGDRSRFHQNRKRKLLKRQRLQTQLKALLATPPVAVPVKGVGA